MKKYCVLIGDIVASRKMKDRDQAQQKLKKVLKQANDCFHTEMVAPFLITRGDEIAAVFRTVHLVNTVMNVFIDELYPFGIRFGIGIGELTTSVDTGLSNEIDGPGFYIAAEALEVVRKNRRWVSFQLNDPFFNETLTSLKNILIFLKRNWTSRQWEVCRLYKKLGHQKKVARELDISQQAVAKILRAALYDEYSRGEETIEWLLKQI